MINGSTIIYNDEFISVLTRHRDMAKESFEEERIPDRKEALKEKYNYFETKLNKALEFSDVVEEVINIDIPRISTVKTVSGIVLPLSNIQVL